MSMRKTRYATAWGMVCMVVAMFLHSGAMAADAPAAVVAPAPVAKDSPASTDIPEAEPQSAVENREDIPPVEAPRGMLAGTVLGRGTKKPVPWAQVVIADSEWLTETDATGAFTLEGLPPGSYQVIVSSVGYETLKTQEIIGRDEQVRVVYYLEAEMYGLDEIVVHGRKARTEVSRQVVSRQELQNMPGSSGDAVKAIENLPGVGAFATSAGLVLRGSNREDSNVYLDGHFVPILFHFGGFKSVYNSDLLQDIEVLLGGFGAEYGRALGGIVNLRSRPARTDRWAGYIDTSLLDATALAEGPVSNNAALALTFRYSLIQYLVRALPTGDMGLNFTTYPNYWDYVARYDHQINASNRLSVNVFGSRDAAEMILDDVAESDPAITGDLGFSTMFHKAIITWEYKSGDIQNTFSPAVNYLEQEFFVGKDFSILGTTLDVGINDTFSIRLGKYNTLRVGAQMKAGKISLTANTIRPPKEGDVYSSFSNGEFVRTNIHYPFERVAVFAEDIITVGDVTVIPGVRLGYFFGHHDPLYVDPRLAVRWQVAKSVALKATAGMYSQTPTLDERSAELGNPDVSMEHAVQTAMGVEWDITDNISLNVEAYYKYLYDMVVGDAVKLYDNDGKGYIYGVEVLLRHRLTKNFFGWLAYSYSVSKRRDGEQDAYRYFDEDVPHNLTLVLSYAFLKTWQVGARLQVISGMPYTPIKGSVFIADNNTYIPLYDAADKNSGRTDTGYQLDLRIDKRFIFDTWMLSVYLDIQNVTMYSRAMGYSYNYDYSQKVAVSLPAIIPAFGLRADF